ncbi:MAG: hypothetical protein LUI87_04205 [Lachnospiraceae bacterium]|nr:hypothetical protein [Lachnospiraceae bacterium]
MRRLKSTDIHLKKHLAFVESDPPLKYRNVDDLKECPICGEKLKTVK